jgi:uncharacterized membrane protein YgcG
VLISLTIFLLSMIAIGQLLINAGDQALYVKLQSQAVHLAQGKLAEVVAGAQPLTGQSDVPFEDDPDWQWALEVESDSVPGLSRVTVRVSRPRPDGGKVECALTQLVLDPALRGSTLATSGSSSGSSSSSSGSSTSGTGSTGGTSTSGQGTTGTTGGTTPPPTTSGSGSTTVPKKGP